MSAFAGLRIIDFTQGIAGPMATMLLADFEAEVIKVEPPAGDRLKAHPGYVAWNRNKQRISLDLHRYEGLRAARELIATADVAVFDAHPGELERLGLDAATVRADNPALIHAWFPPYSAAGRWSQLPPDEQLLAGVSGMAFAQGSYADIPVWLISPQLQYGQALMGATALASAIVQRDATGTGTALTVAGLDGVSGVGTGIAIQTPGMVRMVGRGSRGGVPNYRLYQCADGEWFFLGTLTAPFFFKALEAVDLLELLALEGVNGEFANLLMPGTNDKVIARLEERFREKTRAEWLKILHDHGVPRGPVGRRDEWFRDETVAANDMRVVIDDPKLGPVEMPGVPVKMERTPGSVRHTLRDTTPDALPVHTPPPAPPADAVAPDLPLRGVTILDLGQFIAGTFAPTVLSNFGANVIKIEMPEGDPFRTYGLGFSAYNQGKRSLAIDLKKPEGREVFYDLVRKADVVLDNFRVGVRDRLGIDYATLSAVNPKIITCSVTAYGPTGPLAADPGFDPLLQARSGIMAAQGGTDEPVFHTIPVNDTATAIMAAFAMATAIHERNRSGRGQEIQTCLANQTIICQSGEVTSYAGRPPAPTGGLDYIGPSALQRYYACADGWLVLSCSTPEHFQQTAAALGHPEWSGRMTAEQALAEPSDGTLAGLITETLAAMQRDDALDRLLARGVPAAPAVRVAETVSNPYLIANDFWSPFEHPQWGHVIAARGFAEWNGTPGTFPHRSPLIGEQSTEILEEFGFSADTVAKLLAEGIIRVQGPPRTARI